MQNNTKKTKKNKKYLQPLKVRGHKWEGGKVRVERCSGHNQLKFMYFFFQFLNFILFLFLYSRFLLVIHFIHISVYMSIPTSQFITQPPPTHPHLSPLGVHTFVLYICVSISALQTGSSVPFFQVPHICVNIRYLFFSF